MITKPQLRFDELRLFRHGVADGADNGHHHRAAHAAANQILDDAANIQSASSGRAASLPWTIRRIG